MNAELDHEVVSNAHLHWPWVLLGGLRSADVHIYRYYVSQRLSLMRFDMPLQLNPCRWTANTLSRLSPGSSKLWSLIDMSRYANR
jgi:hypothetical protein